MTIFMRIFRRSWKRAHLKVPSPYSTDGRDLLFFSDPPHLLKTVRNCFTSKSRNLYKQVTESMGKFSKINIL